GSFQIRRRLASLAIIALLVPLLVWAGFGFSIAKTENPDGLATLLAGSTGLLHDAVASIARHRLPAAEFALGVAMVKVHAERGDPAYLLGQFRTQGRWYFFPVALLVKTPIGFLILAVAGC